MLLSDETAKTLAEYVEALKPSPFKQPLPTQVGSGRMLLMYNDNSNKRVVRLMDGVEHTRLIWVEWQAVGYHVLACGV